MNKTWSKHGDDLNFNEEGYLQFEIVARQNAH